MKFSFGIITLEGHDQFVPAVVQSIRQQNIPEHEIIVVGGSPTECDKQILFNESAKSGWITRKKNLITQNAKYENIVYLHDYVYLCSDWYQGFLQFGENWDVCMTRILNFDCTRYRDWVAWNDPNLPTLGNGVMKEKWCSEGVQLNGGPGCVPYNYNKTQFMYVSGAYWVAKKEFMTRVPLNEDLIQCEGEDVEWSYRARKIWNYQMNTFSSVQFLRYRPLIFKYYNYE